MTREIGFWTAVALVVGNMIGSGIFLLPASLARFGGVALVGWVVSAVGGMLLAFVFARLARLDPASGGPYAYTRRAFGDLAGFLVAWGYWISCWCTTAALAVAFVGYLDPFFPTLVRQPAIAAFMAIAAVWLLTVVNIRGVRDAGRVQVVTTVLKIVPLVAIGIGGLFALQSSHFAVAPTGASVLARDVTATTTLTLWAFLGLESATIPAGSIRNPDRTIPRATITATVMAAAIYIISTVGVMGTVDPSTLGTTSAPFAEAARALWGDRAAAIVALGAAISCFGALNGWTLVVGQLPLAVAQDGLFPRAFASLSARGTPARGMLIAGVLTTALVAMNYTRGLVDLFTFIILLATLSTLVPYVFCSLAEFLIARRSPTAGRSDRPAVEGRRDHQTVVGPSDHPPVEGRSDHPPVVGRSDHPPVVGRSFLTAEASAKAVSFGSSGLVSSLAFLYSLFAIAGAGAETIYWGFLLLLAGLPVYVFVARKKTA